MVDLRSVRVDLSYLWRLIVLMWTYGGLMADLWWTYRTYGGLMWTYVDLCVDFFDRLKVNLPCRKFALSEIVTSRGK